MIYCDLTTANAENTRGFSLGQSVSIFSVEVTEEPLLTGVTVIKYSQPGLMVFRVV